MNNTIKNQPTPKQSNFASNRSKRWTLGIGMALLFLLPLLIGRVPLCAQEEETPIENREYRIKAAYLYQFGRYVEWPANTFADEQSPFVIGVVGQDHIMPDLDEIAKTRKMQDRTIQIRRFATPEEVRACHILFVAGSLAPESQKEVIRGAANNGVLLVGESGDFIKWGGVIQFVVEENRVGINIARKAAQREGLTISAKLLQVAHVVD